MDEDPPQIDAWAALLNAQSEVVRHIEAELKAQGQISLTWYDVLLSLEFAPGQRLRMSEIAESIVLSRSALTRSVDKLEAAGLLRRERCEEDERGAYAALTDKGREAMALARPVCWAAIEKYFAAPLTKTEIATLTRILDKIILHARGLTAKQRVVKRRTTDA